MIGLIVEGKNDVKKIDMAGVGFDFYYIILRGIRFSDKEANDVRKALTLCSQVFILTDPDDSGNKAAESINRTFPYLERIMIDPNEAKVLKKRGYKYGVEYCKNKYIKSVITNTLKQNNQI